MRERTAQELAGRRAVVQQIVGALTSGQEEMEEDALQLLLGTCRCSSALCEAVCLSGVQEVGSAPFLAAIVLLVASV